MAEGIPVRPKRSSVAVPPPVHEVVIPEPPAHLSEEARGMWRDIAGEWVLGTDALLLLRAGLESWDTFQRCRAEVQRDGSTVSTGEGMIRQHPAHKVGNDALTQFRQCFRQLGLEPPK